MSIKFVSRYDGGWQGNGFGTTPNSYTVMVGDIDYGLLRANGNYADYWRFYRRQDTIIDGVRFNYPKHPELTAHTLAELKAKVRAFLTSTGD